VYEGLAQGREDLRRLGTMDVAWAVFRHGNPITENAATQFAQSLCELTMNERDPSPMTADSPESMPPVEVGDARIPALGLGTWQNTGPQCAETVENALNMGYRHVDTAQVYGNEAEVGRGLAAADVDREDVFLTTKVWRSNLQPDDVHTSVRMSLSRLGVDAVDLLLAHWPHPLVPVEETLGAMAELQQEGLVRHLGVSNFTASQLREALRVSDTPLVTDQVLYHPYKNQSALRSVCAEHDVALTAYSPLARGEVLEDETLADIGAGYDKSAAQVALRWLIQQDGVVAIPKATGRDHLAANLDIFDFSLSEAEMKQIHDLAPSLGMRLTNALPSVMRNLPFTPPA
jgi:2,5-diketo-D-gluconate reductase B